MHGLILCIILVWISLLEETDARGVGVRYVPVNTAQERTYPSQVRRYYYTYYMAYFQPEGLIYATDERDSARTKTVCTNYERPFENDTFLGVFPCPMKDDPDNFDHCCGESNFEYCCKALDHPSVKLAIGLGTAAGLGVIIGILLCVVLKVKGGKKAIDRKRSGRKKMLQMGIPKYDTLKGRGFVASQSEDGYQIVVKFSRDKKFYGKFWEELYRRNETVAWKFGDDKSVKEAKLTMGEGKWVSIVLSDEFDGKPIMLVSREKAAVDWMEKDFSDICNAIPDDSGCFGFLKKSKAKTHPAKQYQPKKERPDSGKSGSRPNSKTGSKGTSKAGSKEHSRDRSGSRDRSREKSRERSRERQNGGKSRNKSASSSRSARAKRQAKEF